MRIELDKETEKQLDQIRREKYIYGKGHANTVVFLLRFYQRHRSIEKMVDKKLSEIPAIIERVARKTLKTIIVNLFKEGDA